MANPVSRQRRVLLYDMRGHGRSERPKSGYDLDSFVNELRAVLDANGLREPVTLVGHSFGGLLALAFAHRFPHRVHSMALIEGHAHVPGWGQEMAETLGLEGEAADRKLGESYKSWLGRQTDTKRRRLARDAHGLIKETTLIEDLRGTPPITEQDMRAIEVPVLALYGERSDIRDRGERLAALMPRAELHLFPDCSHAIMWEATSAVRDRLLTWLARSPLPLAAAGGV
ncbi:Alpha/beta hydrolase [Sulfidibacter corallicola]